jgi:DNA-binding XRE family transcriptional regulator
MVVAQRIIKAAPDPVTMSRSEFKRLCIELGVTATEVAEDAGVDRNTVGRWLNGAVTPRLDAAMAVARRLGVPVESLWTPRESPR